MGVRTRRRGARHSDSASAQLEALARGPPNPRPRAAGALIPSCFTAPSQRRRRACTLSLHTPSNLLCICAPGRVADSAAEPHGPDGLTRALGRAAARRAARGAAARQLRAEPAAHPPRVAGSPRAHDDPPRAAALDRALPVARGFPARARPVGGRDRRRRRERGPGRAAARRPAAAHQHGVAAGAARYSRSPLVVVAAAPRVLGTESEAGAAAPARAYALYCGAAALETLAEPLFIVAQAHMWTGLRVSAEAAATLAARRSALGSSSPSAWMAATRSASRSWTGCPSPRPALSFRACRRRLVARARG